MLDRAENLLHDHYGGKEYWDVSAAWGPLPGFLTSLVGLALRISDCRDPCSHPCWLGPPGSRSGGSGRTQGAPG